MWIVWGCSRLTAPQYAMGGRGWRWGGGGRGLAYPVATSHILMVLSLELESRKSPEGMKHTEETLWSWPWSVLMHS